jgi:glutamate/tyrosine decarboxylase-like PLP-dependent enzyme
MNELMKIFLFQGIRQCQLMEKHLLSRPSLFEIVTGPILSLLTFRIKSPNAEIISDNKLTNAVYDAINEEGTLFLTHTVLNGLDVIRFAVGSPWTEDRHVENAFSVIEAIALKTLSLHGFLL